MDDENPVADGRARQVKPRLSRWAVASAALACASIGLAPLLPLASAFVGAAVLVAFVASPFLVAIVAVFCGLEALIAIRRSKGSMLGVGMAVSGVIVGCVAILLGFVAAAPAFGRVEAPSIRACMRNDARQIAFAAQEYLTEYQLESIAFIYDPATGNVGAPLDAYVKRLAKGYAPVPARLTKTETFQLGHPKVGTLAFDANGRPIEDAPRPVR
jgi:hypothetical protein